MHQAYFVYKLTCTINGKIYIGASQDPRNRLYQHRSDARRGVVRPLYHAMRKHGVDNFKMEVIYEAATEQEMFEAEIQLIKEHDSQHRLVGYNVCAGGEGASHPTSDTTKRTLSEIATTTWASKSEEEMEAFRIKMQSVGADISEETRQKRSEAAKAQHNDSAKKAKHKSAASRANQDPEKRAKIAEAARLRWANPEFKARMSERFKKRDMQQA